LQRDAKIMELPKDFWPPRAPSLQWRELDEKFHQTTLSLQDNLNSLEEHCREFATTLALRRIAAQEEQKRESKHSINSLWHAWNILGAKAGGLAARNYVVALEAIQTLAGFAPQWRGQIAFIDIKKARADFEVTFPNIYLVRHSIAHPEHYNNPDKEWGTADNIYVAGIQLTNNVRCTVESCLVLDHYSATIDGKLVSYEHSETNLLKLIEITNLVFTAFKKVSDAR
jgi:hypothetical protein